jgi:uncharacterized protein (DUF488 family)
VKSTVLWTIGHSTRPIEELLALLKVHTIGLLVDVRTIPYSRRNPQFHTDVLARSLAGAGLRYHHLRALGGRRKANADSVNLGWRNLSFRGYADYMQTDSFSEGLRELVSLSEASRTAIMCAEAVPWRCHRSLIADALVSQGYEVRHILAATKTERHALTSFARVRNGRLTYPKPADSEQTSRLF